MILTDVCNAEKLKQNALLYISEHGEEVKQTEDWNDVKKNADLLDNLLNVNLILVSNLNDKGCFEVILYSMA